MPLLSTDTTGFRPGATPPVAANPAADTSVTGVLKGLRGFSSNVAGGYVNPGVPPGTPGLTEPVDPITGEWEGRSGGTLRGLVGRIEGQFYGNYNQGGTSTSTVPGTPDTPVNPDTGDWYGRSGGALRSLVAEIYGSEGNGTHYVFLAGELPGLEVFTEANTLVPDFTLVSGLLGSVSGFSTAVVGTSGNCTGILKGLEGFATNMQGGFVDSVGNGPTTTYPIGPNGDWIGRTGGYLRGLIGLAYSDDLLKPTEAYAVLELSGYGFFGRASTNYSIVLGFNQTLSGYSFKGYGGGYAVLELSPYTFVGHGIVTTLGQVDVALSSYGFNAHGIVTTLGRAYLEHGGHYSLKANSGARMVAVHGGYYSLKAHGFTGATAKALCEAPTPYKLVAHGTVHNFGGIDGILPPLTVAASGVLIVTYGHYYGFVGLGHEGSGPITVVYEAYSVTLIPAETGETTATTHYTNYPFDRILRFGNDYYGVAADGLYRLEGDNFDGAEIVSVVETAQTDFKERSAKRPVSLFFSGRMDTKLKVSVTAAEDEKNTYTYTGTWDGVGNQRVRFGRGIKARYISYGFTNHTGEDFEVDELAPEIEVLRRNQ